MVAAGRPGLDVTRQASIAESIERIRPGIVVNAAAFTDVDTAERDAALAHAVNAEGAGNVASACARAGVPMVHISTDYVFDGSKPDPYVEEDPPAPVNAYGRSKLEGETRVAAACSRHLILRTAWLYSPFGRNFARTMLRLAGERDAIRVVADQVGDADLRAAFGAAILAAASANPEEQRRTALGHLSRRRCGATSGAGSLRNSSPARRPAEVRRLRFTPSIQPAIRRLLGARQIHGWTARSWSARSASHCHGWETGARACMARLVGRNDHTEPASVPESVRHERHHPRRRQGNAAASHDAGDIQAASAGLRQADDLLPAHHAHAGGHPGHHGDLDAG